MRVWNIDGIPVTGPNDVCGEGQWILPLPFLGSHFTVIGEYNTSPNATNSIPLTSGSCSDNNVLLATYSNPDLNNLGGFPASDDRLNNIPLRQVAVKALPDGTKMTLSSMEESNGNPFPPTRNMGDVPITVGDWFKASGKMTVSCHSDGTAKVIARFRDLIPNAVYGMYATWLIVLPETSSPTFAPMAFGGVPSIVATDNNGRATFIRSLNYCPMDKSPDNSVIMFVNLGYHADGSTSGVVPQTISELDTFVTAEGEIFESTKPPGTVTMPHIQFPINVIFK